jgi:DNA recombination protein RmuC
LLYLDNKEEEMQGEIFIAFLVGAGIGAGVIWVVRRLLFERDYVALSRHEELKGELQHVQRELYTSVLQKDNAVTNGQELTDRLLEIEANYNKLQHSLGAAYRDIAVLEAEAKARQEKLDTQKTDLQEIRQKLETEFKLIAGAVLDNNARKFNEQQETNLKSMLDPLKEKITEFKNEIDVRYNTESQERASLRTEIKQVVALNHRLGKEAENLTNALRGNTKQQGDWGEAILERILEYVGLQKDIHFTVQESGRNEDGTVIRPDVLVKYPDNRVVVVDSKVSLVHYEQYCSATTEVEQLQFRGQLVRSVKNHIDGLAAKKYNNLPGTLDTVMIFVPVEAAFITASQGEPALWQYAYDKGIILLSPTILLGAMKLVYDYWKRDNVNRNAQEIARRAGSLYDKFVGFAGSMDDVGKHLEKAGSAYTTAYAQLKTGKGNLISQAEQMKQLHIKSSKQLPMPLVEEAMLEDSNGFEPEKNAG